MLSSQVEQAFCVTDQKDSNWMHVIKTKLRDLYDIGENSEGVNDESFTHSIPLSNMQRVDDINLVPAWRMQDIKEEDNQ